MYTHFVSIPINNNYTKIYVIDDLYSMFPSIGTNTYLTRINVKYLIVF